MMEIKFFVFETIPSSSKVVTYIFECLLNIKSFVHDIWLTNKIQSLAIFLGKLEPKGRRSRSFLVC